MKKAVRRLWFALVSVRFIPHVLTLHMHPNRLVMRRDLLMWLQVLRINQGGTAGFIFLLRSIKEYRNVFYLRMGHISKVLRVFAPKPNLTFIYMDSSKIGPGFVLQHGFSTVINAKSIGDNCQVWHNVTIGLSESGTEKKPVIKDNVKICAGVIVIGEIIIGNNVTIGAGSVVTKSVPDNCIVVGNPAVIIKKNGNRVNKQL